VYRKEDNMFVSFDKTSLIYDSFNFPLGKAATDFSVLPEDAYKLIFEGLRQCFLMHYSLGLQYDGVLDYLREFAELISVANPYINFYMDNFVLFLMCHHGLDHRRHIPSVVEPFLINGAKGINNTDAVNPQHSVESGFNAFVKDIKIRQMRLKEDFDAITSNEDDLKEFSTIQRLYLLSTQGRNYLSGRFQTSLMPDHMPMPTSIGKLRSALLEKRVDIVEMVNIESIDDLLGYELYHTLKLELPIRKCKFCNEYFIVRGRSDIEYCNRIKSGESKPCNIIGATKTYWDGKKDDSIHNEFQKAYKRNHSRRRVGTMSQSDFFTWSEEARAKLKECESGQVALEEFKLWLGNKK
jgi:hypothetical protein